MIYIDTDCNAPCCPCKIVDKGTGRDVLVQTDTDFPGFASTFGWDIASVQVADPEGEEPGFVRVPCRHSGTDGTINCPTCGATVDQFLASAREYLEENDGKEVEDPGYFDGDGEAEDPERFDGQS